MPSQHVPNTQRVIGIRALDEWIARFNAVAAAVGESCMAYIRQAAEERMAWEQWERP